MSSRCRPWWSTPYLSLRESTVAGSRRTLKAFAPIVFNGRIGKPREEDKYVVVVTPGQKYHIEVDAAELGSALDGVLQVKGPDGAVLANADDTAAPTQSKAKAAAKKAATINSPDPSLDFTVPGGMSEITLSLRDLRGEGGDGYPYRLTVELVDAAPFQIAPVDDQLNLPKGGTAAVAVTIIRQGFNGPIKLNIANPPPGLTIRPGLVNAGQAVGTLTITASPDASFEVANLKLIGEAQGMPAPVVVEASKTIVFAEQGTLATNVMLQEGLPAATSLPTPITLDAPATPVEIVHGYGGGVPVKAIRASGTEDVVLTFGSAPLPAGFAIGASTIPAKANEGGSRRQRRRRGAAGPDDPGPDRQRDNAGQGKTPGRARRDGRGRSPRCRRVGFAFSRGQGGHDVRVEREGRPQRPVQGAGDGQG